MKNADSLVKLYPEDYEVLKRITEFYKECGKEGKALSLAKKLAELYLDDKGASLSLFHANKAEELIGKLAGDR